MGARPGAPGKPLGAAAAVAALLAVAQAQHDHDRDHDTEERDMPLTTHRCTGPGYPPGGIVCLCVRGVDHTEDEFDVPVGEEET